MLRAGVVALLAVSAAALQPPIASKAAARAGTPKAVDFYAKALFGLFGPSDKEVREEQERLDAEQERLNAQFRKESESDFAFMSIFGVLT